MYRQRRRFNHLFGIRLQRPTMIPSGPSGPGPCILLSASWFFLILAKSSVNSNAICNASSENLQEAQKDSSSTSPPAWPASGTALIGKISSDFPHRASPWDLYLHTCRHSERPQASLL